MPWEPTDSVDPKKWKALLRDFEKRNGFSFRRKVRYFVDENLGAGTTELLRRHGYNVTDVWDEGLVGRPDSDLYQFARKHRRTILTHDDDFLDERLFPLRKSFGAAVFPMFGGRETPFVRQVLQFASLCEAGMGMAYERQYHWYEDGTFRSYQLHEDGYVTESWFDLLRHPHHAYMMEATD